MGQGPLLPIMPAVANAVFDAVGVRIDEIPVTPEEIVTALEAGSRGRAPRSGPSAFPVIAWPETLCQGGSCWGSRGQGLIAPIPSLQAPLMRPIVVCLNPDRRTVHVRGSTIVGLSADGQSVRLTSRRVIQR